MQILIYRPGALGDLIVTLPLLQTLRRADPQGTLHVMAHPQHRALLRFGHADADLSTDDPRIAFLYHNLTPREVKDGGPGMDIKPQMESKPGLPPPLQQKYDTVIGISRSPDDSVIRGLKAATGASVVHCASFPKEKAETARSMREHLAHSARLALHEPSLPLDLQPRLSLPGATAPKPERTWAFHAGAGSSTKQAPPELFLAAMDRAKKQHASLLLLEGPADHAATSTVHEAAREAGLDVRIAVVHSAIEAAILLNACSFFVGNDSGITHLAAACGATGIALFGPADSDLWSPGAGIMALSGVNRTFPRLQAVHDALDLLEGMNAATKEPPL